MDILGQERREVFGGRSNSQVGLLVFALVSLILLLSSLYAAEASVFKKARETALEAASPVLAFVSGPIGWVRDRVGDVGDYFRVLDQNKALREENAALRQWEDEARSLRSIIAALEELDVYEAPPSAKPINAFVIGEANDAYAHSMIVNAGSKDGVAPGLAAIDERGMIGRIVDVSSNASRILLLNDIQSRIPVFVEGSFVEGLLVGRSTTNPSIAITMLANGDRIEPGQRVITSGAGGVLPRGLSVGVVSKVTDKEATVELTADYARTRLVRIINYEFPQVEEAATEATGEIAPPPAAPATQPARTVRKPAAAPQASAPAPVATAPVTAAVNAPAVSAPAQAPLATGAPASGAPAADATAADIFPAAASPSVAVDEGD
ncbi:MAG: rod shape-determining protein MreC [Alphaproteobacteria bacterium RIFCSPHIGHO2_12_FULL_63_12]|nr:MAG: rod shape-determining protein MreC [Alphaproteobacteria bacterium RIFCSPHIGHO2_12_FULL_63_12]